ncbi:adenylate kinase, chloroplastic-like isoform X2 [Lycium barbarum]|uniref:adenylate kinase, chloroplastic-like isoform X2 n=1 Tax=Lycium barbarum TaxID=112863 RepID=UPI00293EE180|nr:adenylate kinase, chloroplastic-like isoform X2 [Lycium barbarum]
MASCCSLSFTAVSSKPNKPYSSPISSSLQLPILPFSKSSNYTLLQTQCCKIPLPNSPTFLYDLVHIAAGDLLRAEIAADTENGRRAKEYMDKGQLVPNEIVVTMVKDRLMRPDSQEKGWLLDGYPRSLSQAVALKEFGVQPDLFILLEVPEEILVDRVVGRRLDPVTGKIYHLKYSPPETEEIAARLTQRFDDTEEKVKLRLQTHYQNVESVLSLYQDITVQVDGSVSKEEVFAQIDGALSQLLETK